MTRRDCDTRWIGSSAFIEGVPEGEEEVMRLISLHRSCLYGPGLGSEPVGAGGGHRRGNGLPSDDLGCKSIRGRLLPHMVGCRMEAIPFWDDSLPRMRIDW